MKRLDNLRWTPRWVSHLGCIKGCLDYLKLDVSDAWLFGATGHALIINVHEAVCPSGPTAWKTEMLFKLGKNIGYTIDGVFGTKEDGDLAELQERAWEHAKNAIDQGLPCYGWELDIPEFYVVYGCDDRGYHFSGPLCDEGKGPKRWRELGDTEIGVVELYSVKPGEAADDVKTVREALAFALEHSTSPAKWIFPKYRAGLAGYDNWISALEAGTAIELGMAYNAAVWAECRGYAVRFLNEARERLDGKAKPLVEEAIGHYEVVSRNLNKVSEEHPFSPDLTMEPIKADARSQAAAEALKAARAAEEAGLQVLAEIVEQSKS